MRTSRAKAIGLNQAGLLRLVWSWLRQVSGDAAYENYLRCARNRVPQDETAIDGSSNAPLSRAEFYVDSLRRRYSTVSRCC